jgi:hypothetical protein
MHETSWKLGEYPNFDWLDNSPQVLRSWSAQRQKFVLICFVGTKKIFGTAQRPPRLKRHGFSIHSWNSNGLLASHRPSNSRRALSDSCHLHPIPHIRFLLRANFFRYLFSRCSSLRLSWRVSPVLRFRNSNEQCLHAMIGSFEWALGISPNTLPQS